MSLMDLLLAAPSAQDRFQQVSGLMGQGGPQTDSGGSTAGIPASGDAGHWQDVGHRIAGNRYGYDQQDLNELDYLVGHESSWDPNAVNPNGGAYGIPQILPSAHPNTHLENDPRGQIRWMLNYIQDRYGGIDNAYQHKVDTRWY